METQKRINGDSEEGTSTLPLTVAGRGSEKLEQPQNFQYFLRIVGKNTLLEYCSLRGQDLGVELLNLE